MSKRIYLPTLKRVIIKNYSLYNKDIDFEFIQGLNLIIGGNGVGKTTFINIVKYALIGLYKKDLDVRNYKGEKRLIRGNYKNCNHYFRNRTKGELSDESGYVELYFNINDIEFRVKRSLYDIQLLEASYTEEGKQIDIPGKVIKQEQYKGYEKIGSVSKDDEESLQYKYEAIVAEKMQVSDFEDLIFFVNQILLFGESRENVLWDADAQARLLSSYFNDPELERKRKNYNLEAKYQNSIARHKQEEIKAITRVIKQIEEGEQEGSDVKKITIIQDIEKIKRVLEQIDSDRSIIQNQISSNYKKVSKLSNKINEKESEKEREEELINGGNWLGLNPRYAIYNRQIQGNHICPMCNSEIDIKKVSNKIGRCFLCNSILDIEENSSLILEKIQTEISELAKNRTNLEREILHLEEEIKGLDYKFRKKKIELFNKETLLRNYEVEDIKDKTKQESSYVAMMNRIDDLTQEKDIAQKKSEENINRSQEIQKKLEVNLLDNTKSISNIFSDFAEAFLHLPSYLAYINVEDNKNKMFLPVIDDKVRREPEELSESQRFFIDYSFRMSILAYFYESPAFYVCETPDSSLDISYEENAADIFMKYLERPNSLILTSNLNNSTFIKSILSKTKDKNVLNLLEYGKISSVQQNNDALIALSKEIEELCNE